MRGVEFQIQFQDIHAGLPEKTELPALGVTIHENAQLSLVHVPLTGNAGNLEFRGGRGNVWIEARPGGSYQIGGNGDGGVFCFQALHIACDALNESLVRWAEV